MENSIERNARILGISLNEARKLAKDDKRIDKGEKLFELSQEQKIIEKQMRQADRKPTIYKFQKKQKKEDKDKQRLLNIIKTSLEYVFDSNNQCTYNAITKLEVINNEREITFMYNDRKFKIILSAPRS